MNLIERLRDWVTDWDGSPMVPGEPPRDGIHCDVLIEAADRLEATERLVEELENALRKADQFITNGVELGFIRMPDASTPDPAHDTPSLVRTALASIADWRKP